MNSLLPDLSNCTVAVIGLGYVGLPLAIQFASQHACSRTGKSLARNVIGFDVNQNRLSELRSGYDSTKEIPSSILQSCSALLFTDDSSYLTDADVFIVTVPTPIDSAKRPDLKPLETASYTVGTALKSRTNQSAPLIIYESTVYPGATNEVCVPILEKSSGLTYNTDFFCGYSPERINPGDTEHRLTTICKVTSGSTDDSALWIDALYGSIITAGTHLASSIKVAEAAKVIENTQRDLNIALVNELAIIFKQLDIDTLDVLQAAGTKWNFLPFRPGLVGGHCIGVDPYYLTHKAEQVGYHPQVVLAGRRINDSMSRWLADQLLLGLAKKRHPIVGAKVLILGLTFKENCPDLRNTKVVDLINHLQDYGLEIDIVDPWVHPSEAHHHYQLDVYSDIPDYSSYQAVVLAVAHDQFKAFSNSYWSTITVADGVILDLKGIVPRDLQPLRL